MYPTTLEASNTAYTALDLLSLEKVSPTTYKLRVKLPNAAPSMDDLKGAFHVYFKEPTAQSYRAFTPISWQKPRGDHVSEQGFFEVLVKTYAFPYAEVARWLTTRQPGEKLDTHGPHVSFDTPSFIKRLEETHQTQGQTKTKIQVGMVAGGTGIAPMYQLLMEMRKYDWLDIRLVYANRSRDEILMLEELEKLKRDAKATINIHYLVEDDAGMPSDRKNWSMGRVTMQVLAAHMPAPTREKANGQPSIFVCGPPGMMNAVSGDRVQEVYQGPLKGMLKELGYRSSEVFKF